MFILNALISPYNLLLENLILNQLVIFVLQHRRALIDALQSPAVTQNDVLHVAFWCKMAVDPHPAELLKHLAEYFPAHA